MIKTVILCGLALAAAAALAATPAPAFAKTPKGQARAQIHQAPFRSDSGGALLLDQNG